MTVDEAERLRQVLGAFYKTVDVMKSARNQPNHIMHVWADDMKAVEDVMFFLEQLRDTGVPAQGAVTPGCIERMVTDAMETSRREAVDECAKAVEEIAWTLPLYAPTEDINVATGEAANIVIRQAAEAVRALALSSTQSGDGK